MLQFHLANEPRLSNLLTICALVHQGHPAQHIEAPVELFTTLFVKNSQSAHCCSSTTEELQPTMVFPRCFDEDQHTAWRAATYHWKMPISHNEHGLGGLPIICCRSPTPHTSLGLLKMLLVDQTLELQQLPL